MNQLFVCQQGKPQCGGCSGSHLASTGNNFPILERAEWGVLGFCFIPGALRLASVFRLRTVATISARDKEFDFDNNRQKLLFFNAFS